MTTASPAPWVRHSSDGTWDRFDLFLPYHEDQSSLRGTWSARTGVEADALVEAFRGSGFRVTRVGVSEAQRVEENEPGEPADPPAAAAKRTRASGKFEVYEDRHGRHRFRLKANNGQVVAIGNPYETRRGALAGVEQVKVAADGATIESVDREADEPPSGG